ncbi:hypothetical protein CRENBAI_002249 [Crenichthys baileyi]|uniref:Uncharacterized protein n=1 Tax=Crenichthys baileyi TaxID=28760 RepID=A0AAV9RE80_9TELE
MLSLLSIRLLFHILSPGYLHFSQKEHQPLLMTSHCLPFYTFWVFLLQKEGDIQPEEKEKSSEQDEDDDGRQVQARRALAVMTVTTKPNNLEREEGGDVKNGTKSLHAERNLETEGD